MTEHSYQYAPAYPDNWPFAPLLTFDCSVSAAYRDDPPIVYVNATASDSPTVGWRFGIGGFSWFVDCGHPDPRRSMGPLIVADWLAYEHIQIEGDDSTSMRFHIPRYDLWQLLWGEVDKGHPLNEVVGPEVWSSYQVQMGLRDYCRQERNRHAARRRPAVG